MGCKAETWFQDDGLYSCGRCSMIPTDFIVARSEPPGQCSPPFHSLWSGRSGALGQKHCRKEHCVPETQFVASSRMGCDDESWFLGDSFIFAVPLELWILNALWSLDSVHPIDVRLQLTHFDLRGAGYRLAVISPNRFDTIAARSTDKTWRFLLV